MAARVWARVEVSDSRGMLLTSGPKRSIRGEGGRRRSRLLFPACIASAALMFASAMSTGGLMELAAKLPQLKSGDYV
jgi:hypothetical protein